MKKIFFLLSIPALLSIVSSCEDQLNAPAFAELAPDNVLSSQKGIEALLFNAYGQANFSGNHGFILAMESSTGEMLVTGGGVAGANVPFQDFNWTAETAPLGGFWSRFYRAIRDANTVIDNIDNFDGQPEVKDVLLAEARFIRASVYARLYNLYGSVVLRESSGEPKDKARASDEEMRTFIETELLEAIEGLPSPSSLPSYYAYGRATSGEAMAHLAKHYLNTRAWEEAADMCQKIIDLGYYQLFPSFRAAFFTANEGNREMISVWTAYNQQGYHTTLPNGVASEDFFRAENIPELIRDPGRMSAWATNWRITDAAVDRYEPGDDRALPIVDEYIDINQTKKRYSEQEPDNRRYMKLFDPDGLGNFHGVDIPVIRYSDILLSRAEALNELNQNIGEARSLVQQVRERAGLTDHSALNAAAQGVALRNYILDERAKEFVLEFKRREDLLRHDLYLTQAEERGLFVDGEHRNLFPIPANEANNNALLVQTDGY